MDNIIVEIIDDTIYCHKKNNSYTNNIIGQHTGIILDLCDIISDYFNCIVVTIIKCRSHIYFRNYDMYCISVFDEYIDFKNFTHSCVLYDGDSWLFKNVDSVSTIFNNTNYNSYIVSIFDVYLKKHYNTPCNYFDKYFVEYAFNQKIEIDNNDINVIENNDVLKLTILDHELFLYLILIIKYILNTYG